MGEFQKGFPERRVYLCKSPKQETARSTQALETAQHSRHRAAWGGGEDELGLEPWKSVCTQTGPAARGWRDPGLVREQKSDCAGTGWVAKAGGCHL